MSTIVTLRNFNRSQGVRIGGKKLRSNADTFVNVDSPRVQRDLGRHSAIGAFLHTGTAFFQLDDGYVTNGGVVSNRATGLVLDVSPVSFITAAGATVSAAAGTATVGAADATNPRVDTIVVNTSSGAYSVIAGTAAAGAQIINPAATGFLASKGTVVANRIVLAYVLVPATATNLVAANVLDARP